MTPAESTPEVPCGIYPALEDSRPPVRRTWLVVIAAAGIVVGVSLAFAVC
jgi:hypothetical protein